MTVTLRIGLGILLLAGVLPALVAPARADDELRTVYIPRHVIYPGDTISADDLVASTISRSPDAPEVFGENTDDLVGKVARRTLMPSELISGSAVRQKDLVIQGRPYKLNYKSDFVSISGTGIPLQSGSAGEMISVRNPDTNVVIKARIEANQTLTVDQQ